MMVSHLLVSTSDTSEPHIHAFRYKVRDFCTRCSRASVDDSVWAHCSELCSVNSESPAFLIYPLACPVIPLSGINKYLFFGMPYGLNFRLGMAVPATVRHLA